MRAVFVDRVRRFSLDVDDDTGRTYLAIPVRNSMVEYEEWYKVDHETFERMTADPTLAHDMVDQARRREIDHLLLLQPGSERGYPETMGRSLPLLGATCAGNLRQPHQ